MFQRKELRLGMLPARGISNLLNSMYFSYLCLLGLFTVFLCIRYILLTCDIPGL